MATAHQKTEGEQLALRCEAVGWKVRRTKAGYFVDAPNGGTAGWHRNFSGDPKVQKAILADVRKLGLDKAEADAKAAADRARREVLAADAQRNRVRTAQVARQQRAIHTAAGEYAVHEDISWVLRTHPSPACRLMLVDTIAAQKFMDFNTRNRRMKPRHTAYLRKCMEDGRFLTTHQGVAFDVNGILMDGQHRLQAIIDSGTSQIMFVFVGIDPAAFTFIDTHARRGPADALFLHGAQNTATVGAVVRLVYRYDNLREAPVRWRGLTMDNDIVLANYRDTKADKEREERFQWAAREGHTAATVKRGIPTSAIAGTIYVARRGGNPVDDIDTFLRGYKTGEELRSGSPILVLRREAERNAELSTHRPRVETMFGQVVVAWNAFIEGRSLNTLKRSADDPIPPITVRQAA